MPLIEHDRVIQAFSSNRTNQAFNKRRLPRRAIRNRNFFDADVRNPFSKPFAVYRVAVTNQKTGRFIVREGLHNLLRRPQCRRVSGDVEMNDLAPINAEAQRRQTAHEKWLLEQ